MSSVNELNENSPSPSSDRRNSIEIQSNSDRTDNNLIDKSLISSNDTIKESEKLSFGWIGCQPKCLQWLLSAKWSLFWMCWAGALQGKTKEYYNNGIQIRKMLLFCVNLLKNIFFLCCC